MPTAEEVLTGLLSTSYKLDETGVSSLMNEDGSFKDDALDNLTKMDVERVANLRNDGEKVRAETYSRGKREALEGLERELRDEFGIKATDKKGKDLIKAIVAERTKGGDTLTEETVKAHPLYLKLEEHANALPKTYEEKVKAREEELRAEFKAERDFGRVQARAIQIFKALKPVLSSDPEKAAAHMSLLENAIKAGKYQVVEEDGEIKDIVPMKADGTGRLEDAHGHPVKFEAHVKTIANKYYEFAEGDQREGADDPNRKGKESGKGGDTKAFDPKTVDQYAAEWQRITDTEKDLTKRRELLDKLKEAGKRNGVAS
jgi:hypothetical protein